MPFDEREHARQIDALIEFPREGMSVEYKSWLDLTDNCDQAKLAKAISALANFGGGYLVFGFDEVEGAIPPYVPNGAGCPCDITLFSTDNNSGLQQ